MRISSNDPNLDRTVLGIAATRILGRGAGIRPAPRVIHIYHTEGNWGFDSTDIELPTVSLSELSRLESELDSEPEPEFAWRPWQIEMVEISRFIDGGAELNEPPESDPEREVTDATTAEYVWQPHQGETMRAVMEDFFNREAGEIRRSMERRMFRREPRPRTPEQDRQDATLTSEVTGCSHGFALSALRRFGGDIADAIEWINNNPEGSV
jgi:hypothetical protein